MSERDARDPYLGLNNHIRQQAQSQIPVYYTLGKVVSLKPMLVRAAGMNLDKDDLMIAQHLLPGWTEHLTNLEWPTTSKLPEKKFQGKCWVPFGTTVLEGTAEVTRPEEEVGGKTVKEATATHDRPLAVGDQVLLIPSNDGQTYYMVEKLVEVEL